MAVKTGEQLKSQFALGNIAKNTDYSDLIDSCLNSGPIIVNAFLEDYPIDELENHYTVDYKLDENQDIMYDDDGNPIILKVRGIFNNLLTANQLALLNSANPGAVLIFTNKNTRAFAIDQVPADGGISEDSGKAALGYRSLKPTTFTLSANGSLMFIKVGESQDEYGTYPVYSVVALAIQGLSRS